VRPGRRTAEYITDTLMYMSVLGSVFLGLLAVRMQHAACH
jgi:preprotein translocase subunit SecY